MTGTAVLYLLDSNTCIRYLNGRAPNVRTRLSAVQRDHVYLCSIVKGEMFAGALRSTDPNRSLDRQKAFFASFVSLSFDDAAAEAYAHIRADLLALGTPIGPNDMLIAAMALANGLTLVTHNTAEFSRISNLSLVDWEI